MRREEIPFSCLLKIELSCDCDAINNSSTGLIKRVTALENGGSGGKAELLSYTGNGYAGYSYPTSLTFSFAPKIIINVGTRYEKDNGMYAYAMRNAYYQQNGYCYVGSFLDCADITTSYTSKCFGPNTNNGQGVMWPSQLEVKKSSDGKTITWYDNVNYSYVLQYNMYGWKYYWLGIA